MAVQEHARRSSGRVGKDTTTEDEVEPTKAEAAEKLKADLDDILDEIDEVLEENAAEFVAQYVQKGGQ